MEIRQLHYFLMLCKELHFSEAAHKLGISQPTLSQQIRVLEDEVGVPLFDRMGKKTVQTEAGAILEHYARQMMQQMENAKRAIADLTHLNTGHLRVAVLPSDLDYRLTSLLVEFHKEFPNTQVQIIPSIDIVNQVLNNEVDIGVGLAIEPDSRLNRIPFYTETYSLYVHEQHRLASRELIEPQELQRIPFVMYPNGFYGRELINAWCKKQAIELKILIETGSVTSLFQLVREGIGATIQPSQLIDSFQSLGLKAVAIEHPPSRDLEMYYRNDKYLSAAARTFIKRMENSF
ncbi:LysR substrate-binding domain-containing protein [Paenibacillus lautus]|uniref:LysR substrate-binding domain-containing protein n=1 Tax=Paenibacillus lautus TaxID=1401 RepID=UPI002DBBB083|nr:LysR substrate-binding domain-containing protein [Paenibacillus lautus]MEC0204889.1 LysR substrate-binding domain-containing protein [Paenibacillus lautus]